MDLRRNHSDEIRYYQSQDRRFKEWEELCGGCGACCGVIEGDPCEHLFELDNGTYACRIYENRYGLHKTKNGRRFRCVPIREIVHMSWPGSQNCNYKNVKF